MAKSELRTEVVIRSSRAGSIAHLKGGGIRIRSNGGMTDSPSDILLTKHRTITALTLNPASAIRNRWQSSYGHTTMFSQTFNSPLDAETQIRWESGDSALSPLLVHRSVCHIVVLEECWCSFIFYMNYGHDKSQLIKLLQRVGMNWVDNFNQNISLAIK
jgi:hypothetical protein